MSDEKRRFLKMNERFQIQTDISNNRSKFADMTLRQALEHFTEKYRYPNLTSNNVHSAAKAIGHKFKKTPTGRPKMGSLANLNHAGLKARIEHIEKFCMENGMTPLVVPTEQK